LEDIKPGEKGPKIKESHYHINTGAFSMSRDRLDRFKEADDFPIIKRGKKGDKVVDAKALVKTLHLLSPSELNLTIGHGSGPELKPIDILKGLFELDEKQLEGIKILKIKQVLK
jgi:hypothetical protein